ncbi:hypothetical protein CWI38_0918p0030 [Hamiltosporidium tvaerminnensis]|uniref:PCI domain-containing protein n=2 Tax=Hamiltosporidium TaxID=1176354 RepID=A0A4Q9LTU8_9MICR|nr:hypothetical protein CWI38_0918p0030 [Hamiltosporidium tvaerminnensis]
MKDTEMFTTILHLTPKDPLKATTLLRSHLNTLTPTSEPTTPSAEIFFHAVQLTNLIKQKKYDTVLEISITLIKKHFHISNIFQHNYDYITLIDQMYSSPCLRHFDFPLSIILLCFYNSFKKIHSTKNSQIFFILLNLNKEIQNTESVGILTVVVLDILIKNHLYSQALLLINKCNYTLRGACQLSGSKTIVDSFSLGDNIEFGVLQEDKDSKIENLHENIKDSKLGNKNQHKTQNTSQSTFISTNLLHLFFYYKGLACLYLGDYKLSIQSFHSSFMLSKNINFKKILEKYTIIANLLISNISYLKKVKWTKELKSYYKLYVCLKDGCSVRFAHILKGCEYEFKKDKVLLLIRRMWVRILMEGLRKIGMVYERIGLSDVGVKLNIEREDVEFIVMKGVKAKVLEGWIEGDVLCVGGGFRERGGYKIREALDVGDVVIDYNTSSNYKGVSNKEYK